MRGNGWGQLGHGTLNDRFRPIQIGTLTTWHWAAGGQAYTTAMQADGTLWTWGKNEYGELAADPLFAEVEGEDRAHAGQACPATSESCVKLTPSFCIAAGRRSSGGSSKRMLGLAGTVSHEFWASSDSSCPASQPE